MKGAHRYLLDTNAASTLIRGHAGAALQGLLVDRDACISVITEAELCIDVARRPRLYPGARPARARLVGIARHLI